VQIPGWRPLRDRIVGVETFGPDCRAFCLVHGCLTRRQAVRFLLPATHPNAMPIPKQLSTTLLLDKAFAQHSHIPLLSTNRPWLLKHLRPVRCADFPADTQLMHNALPRPRMVIHTMLHRVS
jgi:hypothetical protein